MWTGGSVSNDQAEEVRVTDRLLTDIKVSDRGGTRSGLCRGLLVNGTSIVNLTRHRGLNSEIYCSFRPF